MPPEAPAAGALGGGDARKAAGDLRSDGEEGVSGLDAGEGREPAGAGLGIGRSKNAQLELGDSDHRNGDLLGKLSQFTASLLGDEDRGVGDRLAQSSSSASRTSARSSSKAASAGASLTMRRSSEEATQGSRCSAWGRISATGRRLTVSVSRSPASSSATTLEVELRSSRMETFRAMCTTVAPDATSGRKPERDAMPSGPPLAGRPPGSGPMPATAGRRPAGRPWPHPPPGRAGVGGG